LQAALVKYSNGGVAKWARIATSNGTYFSTTFYGVAPDGAGGAYVVGIQQGKGTSHDFGDGVRSNTGTNSGNAVIARYDSAGTPLWARAPTDDGGGNGGSNFFGIAGDSFGDYAAVGSHMGGTYNYSGASATGGNYGASNAVVVWYR
jgi:hypothetical protein